MNWNIAGIGGGLSLDHGGVRHWRYRLDAIVGKIKEEDPDVLVLQEVYDTALAEALIDRLGSSYAHFFTHLGPNVWGSVGGSMVLSKCAVQQFTHTSFTNNHWTLNRGFASLEIKATPTAKQPCARIIGTHLIHGDKPIDRTHRMEQMAQIVNHVFRQTIPLPTLVAGDLNIERDAKEGKVLSFLQHGLSGSEPTCTNELMAQWEGKPAKPPEKIDYISLFPEHLHGRKLAAIDKKVQLKEGHLVKAYDQTYGTDQALSDHHGLALKVCLAKAHSHRFF